MENKDFNSDSFSSDFLQTKTENKDLNTDLLKNNSLANYGKNSILIIEDTVAPLRLKRRLLDLGFNKGSKVKIVNISPLKNSYLLEIHGYIIALRKNAVNSIKVREE